MTERRAHISRWTWARVMAAYGFACAACREPFSDGARVDIDHIWQRATGGPDAADNYRPLCIPCHRKKSKADSRARKKIRAATGANKPRIKKPVPQRVNAWPAGRKFQSRPRKSHA